MRLSPEEFGALVDEALADLPEEFARHMENVIVEVQPRPAAGSSPRWTSRAAKSFWATTRACP